MRKKIDEATVEEIRVFARTAFGLDIGAQEHKSTVLEKLATVGYSSDEITIFAPVDPRKTSGTVGTVKNDAGKECYNVIIPEENGPGGQEPVPVGVNGNVMLIPRGKECLVPVEYIEVLRNAVRDEYDPVTTGYGGITKPRKVPAYPIQILPAA